MPGVVPNAPPVMAQKKFVLSAETSANKPIILTGRTNYMKWRKRLEIECQCFDALDILEGREKCPVGTEQTDSEDRMYWMSRDARAFKFILNTVSDNIENSISHFKTSKEALDKIVGRYTPDKTDIQRKRSQISNIIWSEGQAFDQIYNEISTLVDDVRNAGGEFSDAELIQLIITKLPSSFDTIRDAYDNWTGDDWTLDELIKRINSREDRLKTLEKADQSKSNNNHTKRNHPTKTFNVITQENRACYVCGKKGHLAKDCRHRQQGPPQHGNNPNRGNYYNNQRGNNNYNENNQRNNHYNNNQRSGSGNGGGYNNFRNGGSSTNNRQPNNYNNSNGYRNNHNGNNNQRGGYNHSYQAVYASSNQHQQPSYSGNFSQQQNNGGYANEHNDSTPNKTISWITVNSALIKSSQLDNTDWVLDSGCTNHMSNLESGFIKLRPDNRPITCAGGRVIYSKGIGEMPVIVSNGSKEEMVTLTDVLLIPDLQINLLSYGQLRDKLGDLDLVIRGDDGCIVSPNQDRMVRFTMVNRLMKLHMKSIHSSTDQSLQTLTDLHKKLGHVSKGKIKEMVKHKMVDGVEAIQPSTDDSDNCRDCALGKMVRLPSKTVTEISKIPAERLYIDLCGPLTESYDKMKLFLLAKDEATGYLFIRLLRNKSKSAVAAEMRSILDRIKEKTPHVVKTIRSDNGCEFFNEQFTALCAEFKIHHELTVPYSPQMNGQVERENRSIMDFVRTAVHGQKLPLGLWSELVYSAVYILNRVPKRKELVTPHELWYGERPSISHLRMIGTECYVHIPNALRSKLNATSIEGRLVGYGESTLFYRVWLPKQGQVKTFKDVRFVEAKPKMQALPETLASPQLDHGNSPTSTNSESPDDNCRVLRSHKANIALSNQRVPKSFQQAMSSENKDNWLQAMDKEIESHSENNTWTLVERPTDRNIVSSRWVYQTKEDMNGNQKFKARLVARGFTQQPGIDFDESYAPVTRYDSLRLILSLAANYNWHIRQYDVSTAFLNSSIDKEIYMSQPEGYSNGTNQVCRLNKAIYGLIQSPRLWNITLAEALLSMNFTQLETDQCVFYYEKDGERVFLISYVDDGLLVSSNLDLIELCLGRLSERFKITINERADEFKFIGLQINRYQDHITLSTQEKIADLVESHGLTDAKMHDTPMETGIVLEQTTEDCDDDLKVDMTLETPYRKIIGSLQFISNTVRPDIAFSVNRLAQFCNKPTSRALKAAKRVIRYLKKTNDSVLTYKPGDDVKVTCFSDADYAADKASRRSVSGSVTFLNDNLICWFSRKQKSITLSTFEAEFVAANEATKDVIWIKHMLEEMQIPFVLPMELKCDNVSTIANIINRSYHNATKHVDLRMKFTREKINEGWLKISYVPTESQLADYLTKPLTRERHQLLANSVLNKCQESEEEQSNKRNFMANNFTSALSYLVMLSLISTVTSSHLLPRTSPVLWNPTGRPVVMGSRLIHFNVEAVNPCTMFDQLDNGNQTESIKLMYSKSCYKVFQWQVEKKLEKLVDAWNRSNRQKRSWYGLAKVALPVIVFSSLVSLIPTSVIVTVATMGAMFFCAYSEVKTDINTLDDKVQDYGKVLKAIEADLKVVRSSLVEFERKMDKELAVTITANTWLNQLLTSFYSIGHDLDDAALRMKEKRLAAGFIHAFNLTAPCGERCPQNLWQPYNFTKLQIQRENYTHTLYQYTVRAMIVDDNCKISEAMPFRLIHDNDTHICEKIYSGETSVLFNHSITTGCPLFTFNQDPHDLYYRIRERCTDQTETWEVRHCRERIHTQPDRVQIKSHFGDTYIYCYTTRIEV